MTLKQLWQALEEVKDPEIPVVSVIEMGILRDLQALDDGTILAIITPTFSGCPALEVMKREIAGKICEMGHKKVIVKSQFDPPWSSDWIAPAARGKLKAFGLTSPPIHHGNIEIALNVATPCPRCDSDQTTRTNNFGTTLCRSIYVCNGCQEPFEGLKPL